MDSSISVLIVEDEPVTAMGLQTRLKIQGHNVLGIAVTGEEAFQIAKSHQPDIVLLDVSLAGKASGIDVAKRIRSQMPDVEFAFLTASDDPMIHKEIEQLNPVAVLKKPLNLQHTIHLHGRAFSM